MYAPDGEQNIQLYIVEEAKDIAEILALEVEKTIKCQKMNKAPGRMKYHTNNRNTKPSTSKSIQCHPTYR